MLLLAALNIVAADSEWETESDSTPTCTEKLTVQNMNDLVVQAPRPRTYPGATVHLLTPSPPPWQTEYAVRGRILDRAMELKKEGRSIVECNIGNPQALGQRPLTFARQTLSLLMSPDLLDVKAARDLFPSDVMDRAREYSAAVPSVGAYSESQGIGAVRASAAGSLSFV